MSTTHRTERGRKVRFLTSYLILVFPESPFLGLEPSKNRKTNLSFFREELVNEVNKEETYLYYVPVTKGDPLDLSRVRRVGPQFESLNLDQTTT